MQESGFFRVPIQSSSEFCLSCRILGGLYSSVLKLLQNFGVAPPTVVKIRLFFFAISKFSIINLASVTIVNANIYQPTWLKQKVWVILVTVMVKICAQRCDLLLTCETLMHFSTLVFLLLLLPSPLFPPKFGQNNDFLSPNLSYHFQEVQ